MAVVKWLKPSRQKLIQVNFLVFDNVSFVYLYFSECLLGSEMLMITYVPMEVKFVNTLEHKWHPAKARKYKK